MAMLNVVY